MRTVRCSGRRGGGEVYPSMPWAGGCLPGVSATHLPCDQNDRRLWEHYLAATRFRTVIIKIPLNSRFKENRGYCGGNTLFAPIRICTEVTCWPLWPCRKVNGQLDNLPNGGSHFFLRMLKCIMSFYRELCMRCCSMFYFRYQMEHTADFFLLGSLTPYLFGISFICLTMH